jgi:hypothetical protein
MDLHSTPSGRSRSGKSTVLVGQAGFHLLSDPNVGPDDPVEIELVAVSRNQWCSGQDLVRYRQGQVLVVKRRQIYVTPEEIAYWERELAWIYGDGEYPGERPEPWHRQMTLF